MRREGALSTGWRTGTRKSFVLPGGLLARQPSTVRSQGRKRPDLRSGVASTPREARGIILTRPALGQDGRALSEGGVAQALVKANEGERCGVSGDENLPSGKVKRVARPQRVETREIPRHLDDRGRGPDMNIRLEHRSGLAPVDGGDGARDLVAPLPTCDRTGNLDPRRAERQRFLGCGEDRSHILARFLLAKNGENGGCVPIAQYLASSRSARRQSRSDIGASSPLRGGNSRIRRSAAVASPSRTARAATDSPSCSSSLLIAIIRATGRSRSTMVTTSPCWTFRRSSERLFFVLDTLDTITWLL